MPSYEPQYNIKDKVVIKPDILIDGCLQLKAFVKGTDRVVEIEHIGSDGRISFLPNTTKLNHYLASVILGPHLDFHEECEVSNDGEAWEKRYFVRYAPGRIHPILTNFEKNNTNTSIPYKYVRRIQEPTIKVTVEVNGEKKDPSFLSKETWAKRETINPPT